MKEKKFLITKNEAIATKIIAQGARLISCVNNVWTFENKFPANFTFEIEDAKQIAYTNILSI